jgi:phosphoadenosine phosphosulfate reductase
MSDRDRVYASLDEKIEKSKSVISEALDRWPRERLAVAWTGGKDSTLVLWLVRAVCAARGVDAPLCFTIDEGDLFDEIRAFMTRWSGEWGLDLRWVHNRDVSSHAEGLGAPVRVADLNERNRREIARLGYTEPEFNYEPESFVGNHLMKTVALSLFLEEQGIAAFFEGIRWDEQGARSHETYFSPRPASEFNPEHMRVSPILHFREIEVWRAIHEHRVPFCSLYAQGYRSLGARVTTRKTGDAPAWEQDLESEPERVGRRQDKEGLMEKLRQLGYM